MAQTITSIKLSAYLGGKKTSTVAGLDEHPTVVSVPDVVRVAVVAVQPQFVVVVFDIEHVQVAVRISNV